MSYTLAANPVSNEGRALGQVALQVVVRIRPPHSRGVPRWSKQQCVHALSSCSLAIAPPEESQGCVGLPAAQFLSMQVPMRHVEEHACPPPRYKNGDRGQTYNFSRVFGEDTGQEAFFGATAAPMARQLLRAGTSSVMIAYGVSASGKTHTIEVWRLHGPMHAAAAACMPQPRLHRQCGCVRASTMMMPAPECSVMQGTRAEPGVLPQSLHMIFEQVGASAQPLFVRASHYEVGLALSRSSTESSGAPRSPAPILRHPLPRYAALCNAQVYNECIYDLLEEQPAGALGPRPPLRLKEDAHGRVFVAGLSEVGAAAVQPPWSCAPSTSPGVGQMGGLALQSPTTKSCCLRCAQDGRRACKPCMHVCSGGRGLRRRGDGCAAARGAHPAEGGDRAQPRLQPLALHLCGRAVQRCCCGALSPGRR